MQNKKSLVRNIIIVVALLIVVGIVVFSFNDITQIVDVLKTIKVDYLVIACLISIIYWITWGLSLYFISSNYESKLSKFDLFLVCETDLFFNGITPFNSGGQPFQIYAFSRGKMSASDSTSIVVGKSVIYQVAIVLVSTVALFYALSKGIANKVNYFMILVLIGYFMNVFIFLFLFLISVCKWAKNFALWCYDLISKIKFLNKKMVNGRDKFEKYLNDFQSSFKDLVKRPYSLISSLLVCILNLIILFIIPFFLLKAVGYDGFQLGYESLPYVISLGVLNCAFMCYLPTPGATGGAEFGLQTLLLTINGVTNAIAVSVMLLWRLFTYYLTMIFGLICYLLFEKRVSKINEEKIEK